MTIKTVADRFIHALSDAYSAEKQMAGPLPKMARPPASGDLSLGYEEALPLLPASLAGKKATDEWIGLPGRAAAIEEANDR